MSCNKILLSGPLSYYDKSPCLIIVPILTLGQAEAWRGMISSGKRGSREGSVDVRQQIIVPEKKRQGQQNPVRKITFDPAFGTETNCHPAPDPLLLAVKAVLKRSVFHEQGLMAAGEHDESDDATNDSSLEHFIASWELDERDQEDKTPLNTVITIFH